MSPQAAHYYGKLFTTHAAAPHVYHLKHPKTLTCFPWSLPFSQLHSLLVYGAHTYINLNRLLLCHINSVAMCIHGYMNNPTKSTKSTKFLALGRCLVPCGCSDVNVRHAMACNEHCQTTSQHHASNHTYWGSDAPTSATQQIAVVPYAVTHAVTC